MQWYEKDQSLLDYELQCMKDFQRDFGHPAFKYAHRIRKYPEISADDPRCDGKFEIIVQIPFHPHPESPWEIWKFQLLYDDNHPVQVDEDSGSIKAYPLERLVEKRPGFYARVEIDQHFHHLYYNPDRPTERRYICYRPKEAEDSEINAGAVLENITRWMLVYYVYKNTGRDTDARPVQR